MVQTAALAVDKANETWQELGFLHQDYQPRTYYWEIIEINRRVILTAIIVVVGEYLKVRALRAPRTLCYFQPGFNPSSLSALET